MSNWISKCFAENRNNHIHSFKNIVKKIHSHRLCGIKYNPSKTAAIANTDCRSAIYINFNTKQVYIITEDQLYGHIIPTWINDTIATVESSCGTGCINSIIFVAPATSFTCPGYEYRIQSLKQNEPPDYYHNRPLLIDPKRNIYVCYDSEKNIQLYPLPNQATIHPPNGYFSEKAKIVNNKLVISYKNKEGKIKDLEYSILKK